MVLFRSARLHSALLFISIDWKRCEMISAVMSVFSRLCDLKWRPSSFTFTKCRVQFCHQTMYERKWSKPSLLPTDLVTHSQGHGHKKRHDKSRGLFCQKILAVMTKTCLKSLRVVSNVNCFSAQDRLPAGQPTGLANSILTQTDVFYGPKGKQNLNFFPSLSRF